jgi:hypothetical protein
MKIHSFFHTCVSGVKKFKYMCPGFFIVSVVWSVWVHGSFYGF